MRRELKQEPKPTTEVMFGPKTKRSKKRFIGFNKKNKNIKITEKVHNIELPNSNELIKTSQNS